MEALGFWIFIGACVVAGVWEDVRRKEAEHETLWRLAESGKPLDDVLLNRVLRTDRRSDRDLKVAGLITLSVAAGLLVLGFFLSFRSEDALLPLIGVAGLVGCIGLGLLYASRVVAEWYAADTASAQQEATVSRDRD
jgi:hypothetical protein